MAANATRDGATAAAETSSSLNKGAWTPDEDSKLARYIKIHGPRRWNSVAIKSGLHRCGKSCRLRWLNYLRPDIKRGNFTDAEDDLILRLHRLLGNRWSLIARRLPRRTDNEIKNYWNAHLRKKAKLMEKLPATSTATLQKNSHDEEEGASTDMKDARETDGDGDGDESSSRGDEFFDASEQGARGLEWVKSFLELEGDH